VGGPSCPAGARRIVKRIPRDPLRFDVFNAFAIYGKEERVPLDQTDTKDGFVNKLRESLQRSLENDAFLYGVRTEAMFEALIASIGNFKVLKKEDAGELYANDDLEVPDYRIVLSDDSQLLIEVKNYYQGDQVRKPFEMSARYLDGLVRYSEIMGCELKLAIFWARWNKWTLVSPSIFETQGNLKTVDMLKAATKNEMSTLGDLNIGSQFPLRMKLLADKSEARTLSEDGDASFCVAGVELYCKDKMITVETERKLATFLMIYGDWRFETSSEIVDNQPESAEYFYLPAEDDNQGFEMIGSLSSMFSRHYQMMASSGGEVRVNINTEPGALGRIFPDDYEGEALPLWRFVLVPAA